MIGRNHGNHPIQQCLPEFLIVGSGFDRRIHFDERTESLVIVDIEKQMMRTDFRRDQIASRRYQLDFVGCRDVQHVKADDGAGPPNQWPVRVAITAA